MGWGNKFPDMKNDPSYLDPRLTAAEASLAENMHVNGDFLKLLENGQITKIKLIGDSITQGQASTGGGEDPSGTPILTMLDGTVKREGYKTTPAWANFFRNYFSSKYPSINFFNAGIGGWSTKYKSVEQYKTDWIGTNNDVVFLMLGTNDRTDCTSEDDFETSFESFGKAVQASCNHMYVMTASPANNDFDASGNKTAGFNMTMEQIDKIITKVCIRNGWKHISFYRKMLEFNAISGMSLDSLLETNGGSHPIDQGHLLMWKILQQELGLITNTYDWKTNKLNITGATGSMAVWSGSGASIDTNTPVATFAVNQVSIHFISSSRTDLSLFPEGTGGTLVTYRPSNDAFAYQQYYPLGSGRIYTRLANGVGWYSFVDLGGLKYSSGFTSASAISAFPLNNNTYTIISSSNNDRLNLPEGTGGTLVTTRPNVSTSDYFGIQKFYTLYTENEYMRSVQSDLSWGAWKRVTENLRLSTTARQSMNTVGLSIGDMIYDYTLAKPLWVKTVSPLVFVDATGATVA